MCTEIANAFWKKKRAVLNPAKLLHANAPKTKMNKEWQLRYRAMLIEFSSPKVEEEAIDVVSRWADKVGHLGAAFWHRWTIICGGNKCYASKPETNDALNYNILKAIGEVHLNTIDNVLNWVDRVGYCMANWDSYHF